MTTHWNKAWATLERCNCWAKECSMQELFGLRFGAHSKDCPAYQESLDPVDKANDEERRELGETGEQV